MFRIGERIETEFHGEVVVGVVIGCDGHITMRTVEGRILNGYAGQFRREAVIETVGLQHRVIENGVIVGWISKDELKIGMVIAGDQDEGVVFEANSDPAPLPALVAWSDLIVMPAEVAKAVGEALMGRVRLVQAAVTRPPYLRLVSSRR